MKLITTLLLIVLIYTGMTQSVSAQEKQLTPKEQKKYEKQQQKIRAAFFKMVDDNKDNKITKYEFGMHVCESAFKVFDVNKDQIVTLDEWIKIEILADAKTRFKERDTNSDGKLTFKEFAEPDTLSVLYLVFTTMDKNRDGVLTKKEVMAKHEG